MSDNSIQALVQRLQWGSADLKVIRENRAKIDAARAVHLVMVDAIDGLAKANQEMCEHENRTNYADPREPGWNCPDCGAMR